MLHRRIDLQIRPDGEEWIELERANSAGYCVYNLAALVSNADMAALQQPPIDIWGYQGPQNQSMRATVDWLLPFALGDRKWPHRQSEAPSWGAMFGLLRQASRAYGSRSYEVAACRVAKRSIMSSGGRARPSWLHVHMGGEGGLGIDYQNDEINLVHPAAFAVKC